MGFDDRLRQTLVVKRLEPVTSGGAETLGGADTALTADIAATALTIDVADASDIAPDDWLRVGDEGETEVRQVATVVDLTVTFTVALSLAHDAGDQVRELDDAGTDETDDYGHPVTGETTVATVPGLVQPRRAREVALASQAGVVLGEHVGYLRPLSGLLTGDWLEVGGIRFDILSIADAGGVGHHLELGLKQVT